MGGVAHGFLMASFDARPVTHSGGEVAPNSGSPAKTSPVTRIRKVFPETWLWTNSSIGYISFQMDA